MGVEVRLATIAYTLCKSANKTWLTLGYKIVSERTDWVEAAGDDDHGVFDVCDFASTQR